jgi:O-acetyl-ADP-ribose deacetylase (regulator of RNase III)
MGINKIGESVLEIVQGDITEQDTEAVVNAANSGLAPGGGVAGAIHGAAGPKLWDECKTLGGCQTGEAKITQGYNLKAEFVIHTVGPIYSGSVKDPLDLKNCYLNSLRLADKKGIKSISFPAISAGVFGYPVKEASEVALNTIIEYLKEKHTLRRGIKLVRMVLFGSRDFNVFKETLKGLEK